MKKELYIGSMISLFVIALAYASIANAQNVTTNVSNAAGNASLGVNKTGSEVGKNVSAAAGNASAALNKTGSEILNKTEEGLKKAAGGLGSLLGNASEKLKESSK